MKCQLREENFNAASAAKYPHIPCTPGPGGVDEEQRYTPCSGVLYIVAVGLRKSWLSSAAPPPISPPIRFALCCSRSAGVMTERAAMQSRNPGAKRST